MNHQEEAPRGGGPGGPPGPLACLQEAPARGPCSIASPPPVPESESCTPGARPAGGAAVPWQQAERTGHGGREATPGRPSLESSQGKVPVPCVSQGPEAGRGREPLEGVATPHPPGHHDTLDVGGFASPAGNGDRGKGAGAGVRAGRTGPLSGPQPGLAAPPNSSSASGAAETSRGPGSFLLLRHPGLSASGRRGLRGDQLGPAPPCWLADGSALLSDRPPWRGGRPPQTLRGSQASRSAFPASGTPRPAPAAPHLRPLRPRHLCLRLLSRALGSPALSTHLRPDIALSRAFRKSVLRAGPRHLSLFPGLFLSLGLWVRHSPKSSVLCPVPAAVRGHGGGRHPWAGGRQRSRGYEIPRDVRARRARRTAGTEPRLQETPPPRLPAAWMELCTDIT